MLDMINNKIKPIYIFILLLLTFIFTFLYFNISLSILFAIISFIMLMFVNKVFGSIFIILYIYFISNISYENNKIIGNPILQTDIIRNKVPYNCKSNSLVIDSSQIPQNMNNNHFTYSFWLYINGNTWNSFRNMEWKSIFYRGTPFNNNGDLSSLTQFPGFWLTPVLNNMVIVFQNGHNVERLEMDNIPFNTWTNFTVVLETKSISIYINGLLERSLNLSQNISIADNYNLYIANDILTSKNKESGFDGFIAELIFFNYALNSKDVFNSYNYYKKIINIYQYKNISKCNYNLPNLITNSDYFSS